METYLLKLHYRTATMYKPLVIYEKVVVLINVLDDEGEEASQLHFLRSFVLSREFRILIILNSKSFVCTPNSLRFE